MDAVADPQGDRQRDAFAPILRVPGPPDRQRGLRREACEGADGGVDPLLAIEPPDVGQPPPPGLRLAGVMRRSSMPGYTTVIDAASQPARRARSSV